MQYFNLLTNEFDSFAQKLALNNIFSVASLMVHDLIYSGVQH